VGFVQFMLSWFGPFVLSIFSIGILVTRVVWPAVVVAVIWVVVVLSPGLLWSRRASVIILLFVAAQLVFAEMHLDKSVPVRNECCPPPGSIMRFGEYNLLLISLDTLRADRLGCYGHENSTSPNMDRLAEKGVLFERAYSQAPATLISHSTMFTGLNPGAHDAQVMTRNPLPQSARTITEILGMNGYRTAGFTGGAQIGADFGFDQGFEVYDDAGGGLKNIWPRARGWLDENSGEKFFLFLHSYDIHHPYDPPPPFNTIFFPDYDGPLGGSISLGVINEINSGRRQVTRTDVRYISAVYDGGIRYADTFIGDIVRYLDDHGLLEKTIIVLTSDHGEEFDEHGMVGTHAHTVYDELVHVPLIIRIPGVPPHREDRAVGLVDLVPTLLDLVEIGYPPDHFQGVTFSTMIENSAECSEEPRLLIAEKEYLHDQLYGRLKSVRRDDWKFIAGTQSPRYRSIWRYLGGLIYPLGEKELYNLEADPGEQVNVIARNVELARSMEVLLYRMIEWNGEYALEPDPIPTKFDPENVRRLRELGYVE